MRPLPGRDRRCAMSEASSPVGILLAFGNKYSGIANLSQFWQAIRNAASAELPGPTAIAVRLPLPEVFRFEAQHLIKQLAVGIGVIVFGNSFCLLTFSFFLLWHRAYGAMTARSMTSSEMRWRPFRLNAGKPNFECT